MRLLIALAQAVIIVVVGTLAFGVQITGNLLVVAGFVDARRGDVPVPRLRHRLVRQRPRTRRTG